MKAPKLFLFKNAICLLTQVQSFAALVSFEEPAQGLEFAFSLSMETTYNSLIVYLAWFHLAILALPLMAFTIYLEIRDWRDQNRKDQNAQKQEKIYHEEPPRLAG